jgi:hypothetical protein
VTEPGRYNTEMYEVLGRYVVVWSRVEYVLKELLAGCLDVDQGVAYFLTEGLRAVHLIERCRYLAEVSDAEDRELILAWLRDVEDVRKQRNQLMHPMWARSNWVRQPDTVAQVVLSGKKARFDVTETLVSLAEMQEALARAEAVLSGVQGWSQLLYDTLP